jgi:hypothetical protein
MTALETPPRFVLATALAKAAADGGFRLGPAFATGHPGWLAFTSTTVPGPLFLAGTGDHGPFFLALSRPAVAGALGLPPTDLPGPGLTRLALADLPSLHAAVSRAWHLSRDLPDDPLADFQAATADLPRATEVERTRIERIGQDIFRDRLMRDWAGRCPLTGITEPELLRASHIVPWSACVTDADRLDPGNGLLLSALWDAAFDAGLVSFTDSGAPIHSPSLAPSARAALTTSVTLALTQGHRTRLDWHRRELFGKGRADPRQ